MRAFKLVAGTVITFVTIFFLNGNIIIPGMDLPPFGKLLNPVGGIWNNAEKQNQFISSIDSMYLYRQNTVFHDGMSRDFLGRYWKRKTPNHLL